MKLVSNTTSLSNFSAWPNFGASFALCRKALALTQEFKARLLSEFRDKRAEQQHLVRLALNEAEALAWETDYPHLLFPTLAAEKVQNLGNWLRHQQLIRRSEPQMAYAC
jgi:hypothetical protein